MQVELLSLERKGTWEIVYTPPDAKHFGCRWIYNKFHVNGSLERFKFRLVSKGYNQIKRLDHFNTYSSVDKMTTIRLVIVLTTINNWFIHKLDVQNGFLHGDLQEDVYMTLPPDIESSKPNQVCKLIKPLYGLKQVESDMKNLHLSFLTSNTSKPYQTTHYLPRMLRTPSLLSWYMLMI